ncbi:unnamed protein product [Bursaphelenchus xylophilus]|uniref:(pine wood nematode) hypothetical protein n=1 Tax=Bursaphelenchus xylophilus TaxID=6326 RepID=A0A7I8WYH2_BURXY|nr:unnamed protein product [Bursaphelenchus xylophilus]CAG9101578.1 unnamed protein product [Bursaphelenchus xylophilus]
MSLVIPSSSTSSSISSCSSTSSGLSTTSSRLFRFAKKASNLIKSPVKWPLRGKSWSPVKDLGDSEEAISTVIRAKSKEEILFEQFDVLIPNHLYAAIRSHFEQFPETFHYIPNEDFYGIRFSQGMGAVEMLIPLFEELTTAFTMFPFDRMITNYQGTFDLAYVVHLAAICSFSRHLRWRNAFTFDQMLQVFQSQLDLDLIQIRCTKYLRLVQIKVKDVEEFGREILDQFYYHSNGNI